MSTKRIATLNRGRGGPGYRRKRCFLKLRKDADRKRLFCSNLSTLLSLILVTRCFCLISMKSVCKGEFYIYFMAYSNGTVLQQLDNNNNNNNTLFNHATFRSEKRSLKHVRAKTMYTINTIQYIQFIKNIYN